MRLRATLGFLAVLAVAASVPIAIYAANNSKARSAGELAALFTWAEHKCDGELVPGVTDALENSRSGHLDAYSAGFLATRAKLEHARKTVGSTTTCDLFVAHYTAAVASRSFGAGLWVPIFPEPAWRLPDSKSAVLSLFPHEGPIIPVPAPERPTRPLWAELQSLGDQPTNDPEYEELMRPHRTSSDLLAEFHALGTAGEPQVGVSRTARELEMAGYFRELGRHFFEDKQQTRRAIDEPPVRQETVVGGVSLKLIPPGGYCTLDRAEDADASLLGDIDDALGRTNNKLLSASADCTQLKEWRRGERPFLSNRAQFQIMKNLENRAPPPGIVRSVCARARSEGDKARPDIALKSQTALEQVMKDVKVNELRPLGAAAEDDATC